MVYRHHRSVHSSSSNIHSYSTGASSYSPTIVSPVSPVQSFATSSCTDSPPLRISWWEWRTFFCSNPMVDHDSCSYCCCSFEYVVVLIHDCSVLALLLCFWFCRCFFCLSGMECVQQVCGTFLFCFGRIFSSVAALFPVTDKSKVFRQKLEQTTTQHRANHQHLFIL